MASMEAHKNDQKEVKKVKEDAKAGMISHICFGRIWNMVQLIWF